MNEKKPLTYDDVHNAFFAGMNRGCYVASLILMADHPIDSYPTWEEYCKIIKLEKTDNGVEINNTANPQSGN
jgi:hypothetical protein